MGRRLEGRDLGFAQLSTQKKPLTLGATQDPGVEANGFRVYRV